MLAELRRTGAFDRPLLAVATTTGTGMVDPRSWPSRSSTCTAAAPRSPRCSTPTCRAGRVPRRPARARDAGRTLFDVVYAYWATLPPEHRPRLVVFGESLGAYGGGAAFSGAADLTAPTEGALFVGAPNATELSARSPTAGPGQPGAPARSRRRADGALRQHRGDLRDPDGCAARPPGGVPPARLGPGRLVVTGAGLEQPDWLREPHGRGVVPAMHWFPVVTFWQVTADLAVAGGPPAGHGHHYGPEVATAWAAILHPPGWTAADDGADVAGGDARLITLPERGGHPAW